MLKWEEIDPSAELTPTFSCTINCGTMDDARNRIDLPACIYVDDALMLALNVDHMKMVLAAMIEAIFIVMGKPDVVVRQCPLAMDKWLELVINPKQTMLGLIINTNRLTVAIPLKYLQEVLELLNSTWHPQSVRSPKAYWKTSTSCQGSQLGIPSSFPFVFLNCTCIFQEQENLD
jgi:hypothetical protein